MLTIWCWIAIHLHLTKCQNLVVSRQKNINIAALHPCIPAEDEGSPSWDRGYSLCPESKVKSYGVLCTHFKYSVSLHENNYLV